MTMTVRSANAKSDGEFAKIYPCISPTPCARVQPARHMANRVGYRLAAKAFHRVLCRKQSQYRGVLAWLDDALRESTIESSKEAKRLNGIVNKGNAIFKDYKY